MHSGPFTDYRKVGELFNNNAPIELYLPRPSKHWNEEDLKKKLLEIKKDYKKLEVQSYLIRSTAYNDPQLSVSSNVEIIKNMCDISRDILLNSRARK